MRLPSQATTALAAAASLAACALAGCSGGVGTGEQPVRLFLGNTAGAQVSEAMPECTTLAINAFVEFNGDKGDTNSDFTTRVHWTSQDPSVVFVGDGVTLSPAGKLYPPGTLVALRPGVATVTASYLDFNAAIAVDVSSVDGLHIASNSTSSTDTPPYLTDVGALLTAPFFLKAVLAQGQPESDITTQAVWRFDPATNNAFVDAATGLVHATTSSDGAPVTLVARLAECDREVSTQFRVSSVTALSADYFERGAGPTPLPIGFSEAFKVKAAFADPAAPLQDVTTQTELQSITGDYLTAVLGSQAWYVSANDRVGSGTLQLRLTALQQFIDTKTWQVQNTALTALKIAPAGDISLTYPNTGQLTVTGTFDNGLVIPITRQVTWTSSDAKIGSVSGAMDTAGQITLTNTAGDFQATATATSGGVVIDDFVTVHAFANTP